ncbi:Spo0E family sporulation regulatory protein-aspartic acid phosphatase [Priestia megaterium]|uniref:Spo0E family sporulation regulatory protein-aspartic acid phosphatase n=1 Tax=Priestia megaterium TaxID=1404 RepID=UPI00366EA0B0
MLMVVNPVGQIKDLQKCIVKKRKELIDLGSNYGLLDEKTINCSQDLDKLINLHMKYYSSSTNMFLDNGEGLPRTGHSYGNYKVSDFKYEVKVVELARSNIRFCSAQLIALRNLRQLTTHS